MLTLHFQHIHLIIRLFLAEMLQAHPAAGSNQCLKLQGKSFGWLVSLVGGWVRKTMKNLGLDTQSWI
jgi:hypothetical protein